MLGERRGDHALGDLGRLGEQGLCVAGAGFGEPQPPSGGVRSGGERVLDLGRAAREAGEGGGVETLGGERFSSARMRGRAKRGSSLEGSRA